MDRMEHIHGKLLADNGARVLLEQVDGYLGYHSRKNGMKTYFGYFELPPEDTKRLDQNSPYRLVLDDGRIADIYADIHASNVPGKMVAEFHVTGNLKK